MTKLPLIASCAACFILGSLVPITHTHAQTENTPKSTFYHITFMKSRPGQNAMAMERNDWTSVHQDLVKSGALKSWTVLTPVYAGPHDYDYITIMVFNDMNAYNNIDYQSVFKKNWGDKMQEVFQRTSSSRDEIGNEIWHVATSVGADQSTVH